MHIKHYYLVPKDVAIRGAKFFMSSHWIDVDGTYVFLSVTHRSDQERLMFEGNVSVAALPFEWDNGPLPQEHIQRLAAKLGLKPGDTMKDALKAARAIHRQL